MWVTWKARMFRSAFVPYPCGNTGWKSVTAHDARLPVFTIVPLLLYWLTHPPCSDCLSCGVTAWGIHLSWCYSWLIALLVPRPKPQGG